ncbi:flagellin N-terminal helical domain-containing protein [Thiovibrio sp. JS02]
MRITMQSIHNNILGNLNNLTEEMNRINMQISSGKQISKISEDPVNLVTALGLRTSVTEIVQYQENLQFGDKAISAAENSLTQMKEIAMRAKVLALQLVNGSMTADTRRNAAAEVQQLFEEAITLANTSVNGKYIFGGYRTTGYTDSEPTPFIQDARDGYFTNGSRLPDSNNTRLTGTILSAGAAADISTGDLLINNVDLVDILGADIDLTSAGDTDGLNMTGAWNVAQAVNDQQILSLTGSTDSLSSPYAGGPATNPAAATRIAFYLNGEFVDVTTGGPGSSADQVALDIAAAINAVEPNSGVTATVGTGNNGGAINAIILKNSASGDGTPIAITGLNETEKSVSGFTNNDSEEGVTAKLTTLHSSGAAATAGNNSVFFYLNGVPVSYSTTAGTATAAADDAVAAINGMSELTGVTAVRGTGGNGGVADSVVLRNTMAGDESNITISGYTESGPGSTGLGDVDQAVDATHNTGSVSYSSSIAFVVTTSAASLPVPTDDILDLLGLGGGNIGFADNPDDGALAYGSRLNAGDLKINGMEVTTEADKISDVYQDISAAAKAAAINAKTAETGVSAETVPATLTAAQAVQAGTEAEKLTWMATSQDILAGDLSINGFLTAVDITTGAVSNGLNTGKASNFKDVVNSMSGATGVTANITTLAVNNTAADPSAGTSTVSFDLNGVTVKVNATGTTAAEIAQQVVDAINAVTGQTNVSAVVGDGINGGVTDSIVLYNTMPGDETAIVLANIDDTTPGNDEATRIGLTNGTVAADAVNNTGKVTFSSDAPFTLMNPSNPAGRTDYGSTPVYLTAGDLIINGVDIFSQVTATTSGDGSNAIINAINAKSEATGVKAGRDSNGRLILSAVDGRNLHIETSALGEKVTQLTGASGPQDQVYFGQIRLWGGKEFFLESDTATVGALPSFETGFAALGLAGGEMTTGQSGDLADDGTIFVNKINYESGYVRYAGDRDNDFAIKVGQKSTIEVGKNGETAIMDTAIFSVLAKLQEYFLGQGYTVATGGYRASDATAMLDSGNTGLELADELQNGSFKVTVTSHDASPATLFSTMEINVDPARDSVEDIAQRLNGVPGLSAAVTEAGYIEIKSSDPARYTFALADDTSNFLRVTGLRPEDMQVSNISQSIAELDQLMQSLTNQVSDFGARANRIIVQQEIYSKLELATRENLSEKEDTDLVQALMELKAKETAYQAALSAAAKTMQLSLVDYLK